MLRFPHRPPRTPSPAFILKKTGTPLNCDRPVPYCIAGLVRVGDCNEGQKPSAKHEKEETMEKKYFMVCVAVLFITLITSSRVFALEIDDVGRLEPTVDLDFLVLQDDQSATVTADLSFPLDFQLIPVFLIGKGSLSVSLSKTDTVGEIIYLYIRGLDTPKTDFNIGITPIRLNVSSTSGLPENALGLVITGILFSREDPPYEYTVSFSY